jgi:hypothetical protein
MEQPPTCRHRLRARSRVENWRNRFAMTGPMKTGTNGNGTTIDGATYQIYTGGQATLLVDTDVTATVSCCRLSPRLKAPRLKATWRAFSGHSFEVQLYGEPRWSELLPSARTGSRRPSHPKSMRRRSPLQKVRDAVEGRLRCRGPSKTMPGCERAYARSQFLSCAFFKRRPSALPR